jgi:hypothetical protein
MDDAARMAEAPEFVSIGSLLKATPKEEGGERIIYMEASNEGVDQTSEVVLAKALAEQAGFYKKFGNLDLEHYTVIGAKLGVPDYLTYEIGKPLDVRQRDGSTFVKAMLYKGEGPLAEKANMVWDGMTKITPPFRWFPSVGGSVLAKSLQIDPKTGAQKKLITKVRWSNIGLSRTPVNQHLGGCTPIPIEVFAKSLLAGTCDELDWDMVKTLTAGYGTDSADLAGGAAMRKQSLDGADASRRSGRDGMNYWHFRDALASAIRSGEAGSKPDLATLVTYAASRFDLPQDEAAELVERFANDLKNGMSRGKAKTS